MTYLDPIFAAWNNNAEAMATDIELASGIGIDGYITKPFRIAQVLRVIEGYL